MMKRHLFKKLALLAISTVLLGALNSMAEDTIKVGVTEPLSGNFKDIGERYLEGVKYAAEVINANGGLLGKKVEVIGVDTELKPDIATRKATKLILKDNVKVFCGGAGSSVGGTMSALMEKHNGIFYSYGMDASSLTGSSCSRHFFRPGGSTDGRSYALAQWVVKSGYKRVAAIVQDYSFGKEALAAFTKRVKELDPSVEIVAELIHPMGTKDFAPYISQLISAKPEVIFTSNWGNDMTLLLKQGKPMGLNVPFACYYANDDVMIKGVGDDSALVGNVGAEIYMLAIPTEKNKEFVEGFYKAKGHYPTWLIGKAYLSTMFWAEAVKKAGTVDTEAVIKAWDGLEFDGPAGMWVMRACDHQAQVPYWFGTITKKNRFFDHPYIDQASMIPAKDVEIPCEETGCKMSVN
jgi:branched-chain amino acid transport system substrate-binding protein